MQTEDRKYIGNVTQR